MLLRRKTAYEFIINMNRLEHGDEEKSMLLRGKVLHLGASFY
jgi:hypothetical protein